MDNLIQAAVEAEDILNKAKCYNFELVDFESASRDKMTWTNDKMHISESAGDSRMRYQRNSMGSTSSKDSMSEKFDIFKRLRELYDELSTDETLQANYQGLKTTSYLLEKLLARVNLNTLIINLYPGNKGYSISLRVNGNMQYLQPPDGSASYNYEDMLLETARWPYEEEDLLSYIDNEELPVMLLDLLESEYSSLFYSGCIIAQIRDYRQAYPSFLCDTHHVLLKPTTQSIITDANVIGSRAGCTLEERTMLESALVLATSPPLCLDPRPAVGMLAARLSTTSKLFNTPHIRRQAKRFSQVAVNRKRKLDQFTHHHGLELLELINKQRLKNPLTAPHMRFSSKYPKKPPEVLKAIEAPKMDSTPLALPSEPTAPLRLARSYEKPRPVPDCLPQLVEEYVLETEKTTAHSGTGHFHIKLSILQRPSDQEFLGELYVDRDHVEGEKNGAACRFTLGSRIHANKYIQQFTEIFTEEGRKSVRIKHIVPGQLPRISFTPGMRETQRSGSNSSSQSLGSSVPITTMGITSVNATSSTARSLPILQAQLQSAPVSLQTSTTVQSSIPMPTTLIGVPELAANKTQQPTSSPVHTVVKQQWSPLDQHLRTQQVHEIQSTQQSANQLLAQQLTNPPQPLNPQKLQPAIIHIQHPLMQSQKISTSTQQQAQSIQLQTQYAVSSSTNVMSNQHNQKVTVSKPRTTNPAISALVTSLMNSAHQFQQQAANAGAAKSTSNTSNNSNATILNLLNSAPAAMTHPASQVDQQSQNHTIGDTNHKTLVGRTVSLAGARLIAAVSTSSQASQNYTSQVVTGYSAVPVSSVSKVVTTTATSLRKAVDQHGEGSIGQSGIGMSMPGLSSLLATQAEPQSSALLERLMAPSTTSASPSPAAPNSPTTTPTVSTGNITPALHLQGLSLTSLQSIPGLQNVQVQIPGLAQPISLSLNVSAAPGAGLLVSVPVSGAPASPVVLGPAQGSQSVLQLPIAQLMSSGVKPHASGAARPALHVVGAVPRARTLTRPLRPTNPAVLNAQVGAQFAGQAQQAAVAAHQARRKSNPADGTQ